MQRTTTRDYGPRDYDYNDRGNRGRAGYDRGYDRDYTRSRDDGDRDDGMRNSLRGYGAGVYDRDDDSGRRSYDRDNDRDDRGFFDKAGDEVRSWFGDDDAQRRRYDERYDRDRGYGRGGYESSYQERGDNRRYDYGSSPMYGTEVIGTGYRTDRGYDQSTYVRDYDAGRYDRGYQQGRGYRQMGSHAGKGPRGYERSSDRTIEDVSERLMWHDELDPSDIQVTAENGEVTLEGTVESRRAKRLAEDLAESATGVRDVHNRLRVQQRSDGGANATGSDAGSSMSAAKSKKSFSREETS